MGGAHLPLTPQRTVISETFHASTHLSGCDPWRFSSRDCPHEIRKTPEFFVLLEAKAFTVDFEEMGAAGQAIDIDSLPRISVGRLQKRRCSSFVSTRE